MNMTSIKMLTFSLLVLALSAGVHSSVSHNMAKDANTEDADPLTQAVKLLTSAVDQMGEKIKNMEQVLTGIDKRIGMNVCEKSVPTKSVTGDMDIGKNKVATIQKSGKNVNIVKKVEKINALKATIAAGKEENKYENRDMVYLKNKLKNTKFQIQKAESRIKHLQYGFKNVYLKKYLASMSEEKKDLEKEISRREQLATDVEKNKKDNELTGKTTNRGERTIQSDKIKMNAEAKKETGENIIVSGKRLPQKMKLDTSVREMTIKTSSANPPKLVEQVHMHNTTYLQFGVKACSGASVILSQTRNLSRGLKFIVLSLGMGRRRDFNGVKDGCVKCYTFMKYIVRSGILDCNEFRMFYVRWDNKGKVAIGGGEEGATDKGVLLEYTSKNKFELNYLHVMSEFRATWSFNVDSSKSKGGIAKTAVI